MVTTQSLGLFCWLAAAKIYLTVFVSFGAFPGCYLAISLPDSKRISGEIARKGATYLTKTDK